LDWFLTWWLRTGRYCWSKLRRKLCEGKYLDTPLPHVENLADIEACLHQITWTQEGLLHLYDSISYPQTVWHKKKDDCDGFSVLAAGLLRNWNPVTTPVLLTVITRPIRAGHTVCVFVSPEGNLHYFNNATLRAGGYHSFLEIAHEISPIPRRLVCWDVRHPEDFALIEFHKV